MTTTKIAYGFAVIVPFGFVLLACIGIAHVALVGLRERKARRLALQKVALRTS
jgi:Flp pilus assembly protein protease CpaA